MWFIVNITLCFADYTLLTTLTVFKNFLRMRVYEITVYYFSGASLGTHSACQLSTFNIRKTR